MTKASPTLIRDLSSGKPTKNSSNIRAWLSWRTFTLEEISIYRRLTRTLIKSDILWDDLCRIIITWEVWIGPLIELKNFELLENATKLWRNVLNCSIRDVKIMSWQDSSVGDIFIAVEEMAERCTKPLTTSSGFTLLLVCWSITTFIFKFSTSVYQSSFRKFPMRISVDLSTIRNTVLTTFLRISLALSLGQTGPMLSCIRLLRSAFGSKLKPATSKRYQVSIQSIQGASFFTWALTVTGQRTTHGLKRVFLKDMTQKGSEAIREPTMKGG